MIHENSDTTGVSAKLGLICYINIYKISIEYMYVQQETRISSDKFKG